MSLYVTVNVSVFICFCPFVSLISSLSLPCLSGSFLLDLWSLCLFLSVCLYLSCCLPLSLSLSVSLYLSLSPFMCVCVFLCVPLSLAHFRASVSFSRYTLQFYF